MIFDDLNFYGPNRLNSKRTMTFWEMEARRDRQYFKQVLAASGDRFYFGLRRDDDYLDPAPLFAHPTRHPRLVPTDGSPGRPARPGRPECSSATPRLPGVSADLDR